jgi:hypothetical protein
MTVGEKYRIPREMSNAIWPIGSRPPLDIGEILLLKHE